MMLANICWAAPLISPIGAAKASQKIIERAKRGVPQTLIVEFSHSKITERINQKRLAAGVMADRPEDTLQKQQEYAALRKRVFPNGKLGDASVAMEYLNLPMALVQVPNAQALEKLLSHQDIAVISENQTLYPYLVESLPLIGQPTAISAGKNGAGTKIAVIDSGVDWEQPDFATDPNSRNFGCRKYGTYNTSLIGTSECKISEIIDFTGTGDTSVIAHGTTVAAIAADVAPGAKIAVLQVFYRSTAGITTTTSIILKAIDWVISNANATGTKIVAMNLSLGTTSPYATSECISSPFSTSFMSARDKGVLPVVASGNEGNKSQLPEPACASGAVRVGAVYDSNIGSISTSACTDSTTAADKIACFSNSNSMLTLLAPGGYILPLKVTTSLYSGVGTSEAAPFVASAIAILRAPNAFPNETLAGTISRMTSSGLQIKDPRNNIVTPRLNIAAALAYVVAPTPNYMPTIYMPTIRAIINQLLLDE